MTKDGWHKLQDRDLEAIALGHRGSLAQRELGLDYSELQYGNHDLFRNNDMGRGVFDRLSNETLYHVTGLTRDEAVLPLILGTIRLTGQEILHDDQWYLDHPGRWPFDMAVAEAFNPLNYAGVAGATGGLIFRSSNVLRLGRATPLRAPIGRFVKNADDLAPTGAFGRRSLGAAETPFERLVESEVAEAMNRRFPTSEAWELQALGKPRSVSSLDPLLGPNQVRYQARIYDNVDNSYIDISINYDPTTGEFGIIKPASGK